MVCAPVQSIISPYRRTNHALSLTWKMTGNLIIRNKLEWLTYKNKEQYIITIRILLENNKHQISHAIDGINI